MIYLSVFDDKKVIGSEIIQAFSSHPHNPLVFVLFSDFSFQICSFTKTIDEKLYMEILHQSCLERYFEPPLNLDTFSVSCEKTPIHENERFISVSYDSYLSIISVVKDELPASSCSESFKIQSSCFSIPCSICSISVPNGTPLSSILPIVHENHLFIVSMAFLDPGKQLRAEGIHGVSKSSDEKGGICEKSESLFPKLAVCLSKNRTSHSVSDSSTSTYLSVCCEVRPKDKIVCQHGWSLIHKNPCYIILPIERHEDISPRSDEPCISVCALILSQEIILMNIDGIIDRISTFSQKLKSIPSGEVLLQDQISPVPRSVCEVPRAYSLRISQFKPQNGYIIFYSDGSAFLFLFRFSLNLPSIISSDSVHKYTKSEEFISFSPISTCKLPKISSILRVSSYLMPILPIDFPSKSPEFSLSDSFSCVPSSSCCYFIKNNTIISCNDSRILGWQVVLSPVKSEIEGSDSSNDQMKLRSISYSNEYLDRKYLHSLGNIVDVIPARSQSQYSPSNSFYSLRSQGNIGEICPIQIGIPILPGKCGLELDFIPYFIESFEMPIFDSDLTVTHDIVSFEICMDNSMKNLQIIQSQMDESSLSISPKIEFPEGWCSFCSVLGFQTEIGIMGKQIDIDLSKQVYALKTFRLVHSITSMKTKQVQFIEFSSIFIPSVCYCRFTVSKNMDLPKKTLNNISGILIAAGKSLIILEYNKDSIEDKSSSPSNLWSIIRILTFIHPITHVDCCGQYFGICFEKLDDIVVFNILDFFKDYSSLSKTRIQDKSYWWEEIIGDVSYYETADQTDGTTMKLKPKDISMGLDILSCFRIPYFGSSISIRQMKLVQWADDMSFGVVVSTLDGKLSDYSSLSKTRIQDKSYWWEEIIGDVSYYETADQTDGTTMKLKPKDISMGLDILSCFRIPYFGSSISIRQMKLVQWADDMSFGVVVSTLDGKLSVYSYPHDIVGKIRTRGGFHPKISLQQWNIYPFSSNIFPICECSEDYNSVVIRGIVISPNIRECVGISCNYQSFLLQKASSKNGEAQFELEPFIMSSNSTSMTVYICGKYRSNGFMCLRDILLLSDKCLFFIGTLSNSEESEYGNIASTRCVESKGEKLCVQSQINSQVSVFYNHSLKLFLPSKMCIVQSSWIPLRNISNSNVIQAKKEKARRSMPRGHYRWTNEALFSTVSDSPLLVVCHHQFISSFTNHSKFVSEGEKDSHSVQSQAEVSFPNEYVTLSIFSGSQCILSIPLGSSQLECHALAVLDLQDTNPPQQQYKGLCQSGKSRRCVVILSLHNAYISDPSQRSKLVFFSLFRTDPSVSETSMSKGRFLDAECDTLSRDAATSHKTTLLDWEVLGCLSLQHPCSVINSHNDGTFSISVND
ncbi:hypothetical protein ADUPG1_006132, partial [Aduncisulcus paluster]